MSSVMVIGISVAIGGAIFLISELLLRAVRAQPALRICIGGVAALAGIWFSQGVVAPGAAPPAKAAAAIDLPPELAGQPGLALILQQHPEDLEPVKAALAILHKDPRDRNAATTLMRITFKHLGDYALHTSDHAILAFTSMVASGLQTMASSSPKTCGAANPGGIAQEMALLTQGRGDVFNALVKDAIEHPQAAPAEADLTRLFAVVQKQLQADPNLKRVLSTGSCRSALALYSIVERRLSPHEFATLLRGGIGMILGKMSDVIG